MNEITQWQYFSSLRSRVAKMICKYSDCKATAHSLQTSHQLKHLTNTAYTAPLILVTCHLGAAAIQQKLGRKSLPSGSGMSPKWCQYGKPALAGIILSQAQLGISDTSMGGRTKAVCIRKRFASRSSPDLPNTLSFKSRYVTLG